MVQYRRYFVPGGTYFFTLTLVDRHSSSLVAVLPVDWAGDVSASAQGYGERSNRA
jgi:hypothetical protein